LYQALLYSSINQSATLPYNTRNAHNVLTMPKSTLQY